VFFYIINGVNGFMRSDRHDLPMIAVIDFFFSLFPVNCCYSIAWVSIQGIFKFPASLSVRNF
jgi:hypothetical protein